MKTYSIIGLMSGTSLDGLDVCHVSFSSSDYNFQIINAETFPYEYNWKTALQNAVDLPPEEILKLNSEYGFYLGEKVKYFCKKYNIKNVDCIASHGHTIFHNPENKYTLQIGHGAAIAKLTKYPVICDFRSQDVLLGGQGAPLVPIGDELLFSNYEACLNLGGFSNISFKKNNQRIAFDISPVNTILNYIASKENLAFDDKGNLARQGTPIIPLMNKLNKLEYYSALPPKSLGIEWVKKNIYPLISTKESNKDLLSTLTHHIAKQISQVITQNNLKTILVTGGGAKNSFLLELIQSKTSANISVPEERLVDFKEAVVFAFLGLLRLENKTNVLSSVTGAEKDHSSGIIYYP